MALGMQVGLGSGHIVPSSPPQKRGHAEPPISGPFLLWPDGWCIRIPLGTEVGLSLGDIVLDGDPAPPPLKGQSPPNFQPVFVVANRLDGLRCHLVW